MRPAGAAALVALASAVAGAQGAAPPADSTARATAASAASALAGVDAAGFLARVRVARLAQDSALQAYEALSRERVTVTLAIARTGPLERTIYRRESVARVRWSRAHGAEAQLVGRRRYDGMPRLPGMPPPPDVDILPAVPYYPGRDALWIVGGEFAAPAVSEREDTPVHPLAAGAERHYRYALGDSLTIRLPDGRALRLRELRVTPRQPGWRLSVGSLWFDDASAQLVRAAYRLALPVDLAREGRRAADPADRPPRLATWLLTPMRGSLEAVTVEHGLYEGRFWLPRAQVAEGRLEAGPSRVAIRLEQRFTYDRVNGTVPAPRPPSARLQALLAGQDSLFAGDSLHALARDSALAAVRTRGDSARLWAAWRTAREARWAPWRARRDSVRAGECADPSASRERRTMRHGRRLPVRTEIPCDRARLANADVFDAPLLAEDEPTWQTPGQAELRRLLDLGTQAAWGPQRPTLHGPVAYTRYNRVEGLSTGGAVRQELGLGWRWEAGLRASAADRQLNGEAFAERAAAARTLRAGAYRRLEQADDYGAAFAFGASLQNLVSGLDEQFYYRAAGVELAGTRAGDRPGAGALTWRVFGERQWHADPRAAWTLRRALGQQAAAFDANVVDTVPGRPGTLGGAAVRWRALRGDDASPWRLAADLRGEAAAGTFGYGRGAVDLTVERRLPAALRARTTASVGSSVGALPPQRWWNVGGWQTVRGTTAGTRRGDAFWMGRGELQLDRFRRVQPVGFVDAGWAGARGTLAESVRPGAMVRGAGAGVALMNGLVRLDAARGLDAGARWRFAGYAVTRF